MYHHTLTLEPDPDNAGVGSDSSSSWIKKHAFLGQEGVFFVHSIIRKEGDI